VLMVQILTFQNPSMFCINETQTLKVIIFLHRGKILKFLIKEKSVDNVNSYYICTKEKNDCRSSGPLKSFGS